MVFPFPATTCGNGTLLPTAPGTVANYNEITATADLAAMTFVSPNSILTDQGFTLFERSGNDWIVVQTVTATTSIGNLVETFSAPSLEGQRLVVARLKPVTSLNRVRTASLYERISGQLVLQREISPSSGDSLLFARAIGLRGNNVFLSGPLGANGAVFVYDFGTGNLLQTIQPAGLDVEDSIPTALAVDSVNNRALVGWSLFDRNDINNAGWIFTLEPNATGPGEGSGPWTFSGVAAAPLPDSVARDSFETY